MGGAILQFGDQIVGSAGGLVAIEQQLSRVIVLADKVPCRFESSEGFRGA